MINKKRDDEWMEGGEGREGREGRGGGGRQSRRTLVVGRDDKHQNQERTHISEKEIPLDGESRWKRKTRVESQTRNRPLLLPSSRTMLLYCDNNTIQDDGDGRMGIIRTIRGVIGERVWVGLATVLYLARLNQTMAPNILANQHRDLPTAISKEVTPQQQQARASNAVPSERQIGSPYLAHPDG